MNSKKTPLRKGFRPVKKNVKYRSPRDVEAALILSVFGDSKPKIWNPICTLKPL